MSFFHNRKVCTEICIEYFIKSDPSKSRSHLSFYVCSHRITEFFAKSRPHRRSRLYYNMFCLIRNSGKNVVDIALFVERARRTCRDTLSAADAACISQSHLERRADKRGKSSVVRSDHSYALHFFTDGRTSPAKDTFVVIPHHMNRAFIQFIMCCLALEVIFICHSEFLTKLLKFTLPASDTRQTFFVMIRQKQL